MKRILTAALALSLLSGTAALAQPDRHDDRRGYSQGRDDYRDRGDRHDNRDYGRNRGHDRGHHWARGQRLPRSYYVDRTYYIDHRAHHLRAPPRGYRWVEVDNNYAMVALATGLIASIVAHQ